MALFVKRVNISNIVPEVIIISQTSPLLSDNVTSICQWILYSVLCQLVDLFGIVTNIINIICFAKQGLKDAVNVSLLGLAVADVGCLTTVMWTNICVNPSFIALDLPFDPTEFQYLTGGMSHCTFTRVSAWITGLITLERCLCITVPLKVKRVVTPRMVSVIIICVFVSLISAAAPVYVVNRLAMKFSPARNKTVLGLVYTEDRESVEKISYVVNNVCIPFAAFMIIIICTTILVIKLKEKTKWRQTSSSAVQGDKVSAKNRKVAKMVVMISTLFIVCFVPVSILFMAMSFVPGLSLDGNHRNIVLLAGGLGLVLESINSSVNIFIYYHMSTKYRIVFCQLFGTFIRCRKGIQVFETVAGM